MKNIGGGFMAWVMYAASGTGSLVFIDHVTADRSRKNNLLLSTEMFYLLRQNQQDNGHKHTAPATN